MHIFCEFRLSSKFQLQKIRLKSVSSNLKLPHTSRQEKSQREQAQGENSIRLSSTNEWNREKEHAECLHLPVHSHTVLHDQRLRYHTDDQLTFALARPIIHYQFTLISGFFYCATNSEVSVQDYVELHNTLLDYSICMKPTWQLYMPVVEVLTMKGDQCSNLTYRYKLYNNDAASTIEASQSATTPARPWDFWSRCRSVSWSTLSEAVDRSSRVSIARLSESSARRMSDSTLSTAVSVEWWSLHADWRSGSR